MHLVTRLARRRPIFRYLAINSHRACFATGASKPARRTPQKRSPHAILGIAIGADKDDIKRAFLARAQETHPDKPDGDKHEFRRVQEAWEALRDGTGKDGKTAVNRATAARASFAKSVRDIRDASKGQVLGARESATLGAACADARALEGAGRRGGGLAHRRKGAARRRRGLARARPVHADRQGRRAGPHRRAQEGAHAAQRAAAGAVRGAPRPRGGVQRAAAAERGGRLGLRLHQLRDGRRGGNGKAEAAAGFGFADASDFPALRGRCERVLN